MIKNSKLRMQLCKNTYQTYCAAKENKKMMKSKTKMSKSIQQSKGQRKMESKVKHQNRYSSKSQTKSKRQKFLSKLYQSTFRTMKQYQLQNSYIARKNKSQIKPYICYNQNRSESGNKFVNNRQVIKKLNIPKRGAHSINHSNAADRLSFLKKIDHIYNCVTKEKTLQQGSNKQHLPSFVQYFLGDALYFLKRKQISQFQFQKMCLDSYYKAQQDDIKLFMGQHLYLQNESIQKSRQKSILSNSTKNQPQSLYNSHDSLRNSLCVSKNSTIIASQKRKNNVSNSKALKQRRNTFDLGNLRKENTNNFKPNVFSGIQQNTPLFLQTFRNTTSFFATQNNCNKQNQSKTKNLRQSRQWQRQKRKFYFQNLQKKQVCKQNQSEDLTLQRIQFKLNSYLQKIGNSIQKNRFIEQNNYNETQNYQRGRKSRFLMI